MLLFEEEEAYIFCVGDLPLLVDGSNGMSYDDGGNGDAALEEDNFDTAVAAIIFPNSFFKLISDRIR